MHGRYLRNKGGEPGGQAALRCRKDQLHEEVRKGRLRPALAGRRMASALVGGSKRGMAEIALRRADGFSHLAGSFSNRPSVASRALRRFSSENGMNRNATR